MTIVLVTGEFWSVFPLSEIDLTWTPGANTNTRAAKGTRFAWSFCSWRGRRRRRSHLLSGRDTLRDPRHDGTTNVDTTLECLYIFGVGVILT